MKILNWLLMIIITLIAGIVLKYLLALLGVKSFSVNVFNTKDGEIQQYGYSNILKVLFMFFSCFTIIDCSFIIYFYRKDIPDILNTMDKKDLLLVFACSLAAIFVIFLGFAFLYMGCILTKDELIIKKMFWAKRITYDEIRKYAKQCTPVLNSRRLYILLNRKIVVIPVINLNEGLGFTNELMKRCGLGSFEEWKYAAVIFQGKNLYERDYKRMKKIHKKRKYR